MSWNLSDALRAPEWPDATAFTITYLLEYLFVIDFLVSARLWSPRLLSALRSLSGKTSFWNFHGMEEALRARFVIGGNNTRMLKVDAGIEVPPVVQTSFSSRSVPARMQINLAAELAIHKDDAGPMLASVARLGITAWNPGYGPRRPTKIMPPLTLIALLSHLGESVRCSTPWAN